MAESVKEDHNTDSGGESGEIVDTGSDISTAESDAPEETADELPPASLPAADEATPARRRSSSGRGGSGSLAVESLAGRVRQDPDNDIPMEDNDADDESANKNESRMVSLSNCEALFYNYTRRGTRVLTQRSDIGATDRLDRENIVKTRAIYPANVVGYRSFNSGSNIGRLGNSRTPTGGRDEISERRTPVARCHDGLKSFNRRLALADYGEFPEFANNTERA